MSICMYIYIYTYNHYYYMYIIYNIYILYIYNQYIPIIPSFFAHKSRIIVKSQWLKLPATNDPSSPNKKTPFTWRKMAKIGYP